MSTLEDRQGRVEALRELLQALCSSDLTLSEAKSLRERMFELIEGGPLDRGESVPFDASHLEVGVTVSGPERWPSFCLCASR